MLGSLIIVFREVMEAGLVIGIILAATRGIPKRGIWVSGGILAGILGAIIFAFFAGAISSSFSGNGQDIFSAVILSIAVVMLSWQIVWMASHGREMGRQMKQMGEEVKSGEKSLAAMGIVVAIAVLREGIEVALFLYGIVVSAHVGMLPLLSGGVLGIAGGALLSFALYRGLIIIPLRYLFSVTNCLISVLAAGMASQAAGLLASDDIIPAMGYNIWDTSWFLSDGSWLGKTAKVLIGYSSSPDGIQVLTWIVVIVVLACAETYVRKKSQKN